MNPEAEASTAKKPQRRRWWRIPAIVLGVIVGLILLILVAVSIILTPERLTRLVEKYGTEYLQDGRVEAKRIELTIWSSFPHTTLDVDSLRVLCDAPGVPQEGDTVMAIDRFHGRLNLPAILIGSFRLSHVELEGPRFTLWKLSLIHI